MINEELKKEIDILKAEIDSMKRAYTFPFEISNAIAERISDKEQMITRTSTKTANIQRDISLSGGVETISVTAYPDGFRVFKLAGKDYYIPYYNLT